MKKMDEMKSNDESVRPCHQEDDGDRIDVTKQDSITLLEISFQNFALLTIAVPIIALIIDFLLAFSLDYQQISDYNWRCGPVNIPSFSRIINLPKERIIWNAAVLFHIPLRFLLVSINFFNYMSDQEFLIRHVIKSTHIFVSRVVFSSDRICRIPSDEVCNRKLHTVFSRIIILSGSVEILMILLLTVIGEREESNELNNTHFNWHVRFFMIFAFCSAIYFAVITATYRRSKHYMEHSNGHWSFNLKFYLTLVYIALLPVTFIFFVMYWILCYNFGMPKLIIIKLKNVVVVFQ